jgi:hypothetical protein
MLKALHHRSSERMKAHPFNLAAALFMTWAGCIVAAPLADALPPDLANPSVVSAEALDKLQILSQRNEKMDDPKRLDGTNVLLRQACVARKTLGIRPGARVR